MQQKDIEKIRQLLSENKKISIVTHQNPDGDSLGSSLALYHYLKQKNLEVHNILPNAFPQSLEWLNGTEQALIAEEDLDTAKQHIAGSDIIFSLDHNAHARTGVLEKPLTDADALFIMIDHHRQPEDYATYQYSDHQMSSTSEMIYHFLDKLGDTDMITKAMAECLYCGIMTDTGSFKYRSTTATTHEVIANLIRKGADGEKIQRSIYDTNSLDRLRLLGTALDNLVFDKRYRTAYITISSEEMDRHNFQRGDSEGFVNYGLSLKDAVMAIIFKEYDDDGVVKISLRSKGDFDVNTLARKHFNGGGHKNAAGGRLECSLGAAVDRLISILPDYEEELQSTEI